MEIPSITSVAQATETHQALLQKKAANTQQNQALALIESSMPFPETQDSAKRPPHLLNAQA